MVSLAKRLGTTLALVTVTLAFYQGTTVQKVYAQEVDLDTLFQKFPLNSRCYEYHSSSQTKDVTERGQTLKSKTC